MCVYILSPIVVSRYKLGRKFHQGHALSFSCVEGSITTQLFNWHSMLLPLLRFRDDGISMWLPTVIMTSKRMSCTSKKVTLFFFYVQKIRENLFFLKIIIITKDCAMTGLLCAWTPKRKVSQRSFVKTRFSFSLLYIPLVFRLIIIMQQQQQIQIAH